MKRLFRPLTWLLLTLALLPAGCGGKKAPNTDSSATPDPSRPTGGTPNPQRKDNMIKTPPKPPPPPPLKDGPK